MEQPQIPLTGPEAIEFALANLDIDALEASSKEVIKSKKVSKRPGAVDVLNVIAGMKKNNLKPGDFMIRQVPVIPPAFRPYSTIGTTFMPGDANELYGDVVKFNQIYGQTRSILGDEAAAEIKPQLYNAVKAVYGYGEPVSPKLKERGLKGHLTQILGPGPKFSMAQRKLFSKTQDSVGRGVIVVDPELTMDEVGVPRDMAWNLYGPYVQRRIAQTGMKLAEALQHVVDRSPFAERMLLKEMEARPVIYSRAPAWHKFNTIAGRPKLIDGSVIAINPLVTTGATADFDGDTVNLHVPSMDESVKEAHEKLMPSKMLFSIKSPDKVVPVPKQEQILGLATANYRPAKNVWQFGSEKEALKAIEQGKVSLSDDIDFPDLPEFGQPLKPIPAAL